MKFDVRRKYKGFGHTGDEYKKYEKVKVEIKYHLNTWDDLWSFIAGEIEASDDDTIDFSITKKGDC